MIHTQYFIGFPTNEIKRKERKRKKQKKYQRYKCEKGKCNFYLFADDMTVYIENTKVYSKEYLKLLSEFSKVTIYKGNIKVYFISIN